MNSILQFVDLIFACADSVLLNFAVSSCVSSTGSEVVKPATVSTVTTENSIDFIVNSINFEFSISTTVISDSVSSDHRLQVLN